MMGVNYEYPEKEAGAPDIEMDKDARLWGMLCHLSALAMYVLPSLGSILGPLVVWLIKKNEMPFVNDQGKEALNFQLSLLLYCIISGMLTIILIGFLLLVILLVSQLTFIIVASIKANNGEYYRYPLTIRFIK